jgi:hypothetical protein
MSSEEAADAHLPPHKTVAQAPLITLLPQLVALTNKKQTRNMVTILHTAVEQEAAAALLLSRVWLN